MPLYILSSDNWCLVSFGHSYQFACLLYNGVSQPFLEPETSLVEADFPTDPKGVGGGFRVTQAHDTYRALDFCSCYISCTQSIRRQIPEAADPTSEHQASDPGRCGPHLRASGVRSRRLRTPPQSVRRQIPEAADPCFMRMSISVPFYFFPNSH